MDPADSIPVIFREIPIHTNLDLFSSFQNSTFFKKNKYKPPVLSWINERIHRLRDHTPFYIIIISVHI